MRRLHGLNRRNVAGSIMTRSVVDCTPKMMRYTSFPTEENTHASFYRRVVEQRAAFNDRWPTALQKLPRDASKLLASLDCVLTQAVLFRVELERVDGQVEDGACAGVLIDREGVLSDTEHLSVVVDNVTRDGRVVTFHRTLVAQAAGVQNELLLRAVVIRAKVRVRRDQGPQEVVGDLALLRHEAEVDDCPSKVLIDELKRGLDSLNPLLVLGFFGFLLCEFVAETETRVEEEPGLDLCNWVSICAKKRGNRRIQSGFHQSDRYLGRLG